MGAKSRGNWNIGWCPKSPSCKNLNVTCDDCLKYSNYEGVDEDARHDLEGGRENMRSDVPRQ